jgi:replicative DNA helicase
MTSAAHDDFDEFFEEQAVLGGLLHSDADTADVAEVFAQLDPAAFRRAVNADMFAAARELHRDGVAIDVVTLANKLEAMGRLKAVGGTGALAALADQTPTAANVVAYARMIKEAWLKRKLSAISTDASRAAADPAKSATDVAQRLIRDVTELSECAAPGRLRSLRHIGQDVFRKLQRDHEAGVEATGLPTSFYLLDQVLGGGMQPGDFIVVAGRPSMGKSAIAFEIGLNVALSSEATVMIASLEMSGVSLMQRLLASHASVDSRCLRAPAKLRGDDWSRLGRAFNRAATDKVQVIDQDGMTIDDIRAKARTCKARHGLGLVIVDYLQLVRPTPGKRDRTREREVAEMSASLKGLAKELGVPVMCLAQLNRAVETRDGKRPRLSDLRESGSLEQDADVVMLVHREAYYDPSKDKSIAEVIVAKQRNGPTGVVKLGWDGQFSRFYNRDHRDTNESAQGDEHALD